MMGKSPSMSSNKFVAIGSYMMLMTITTMMMCRTVPTARAFSTMTNTLARKIRQPMSLRRTTSSILWASTSTSSGSSSDGMNKVLSFKDTSRVTQSMAEESEREFQILCQHYEGKTTTRTPRLISTLADVVQYLDDHDIQTVLFDCDGVLYRSPDPAPGAKACLQYLLQTRRHKSFSLRIIRLPIQFSCVTS